MAARRKPKRRHAPFGAIGSPAGLRLAPRHRYPCRYLISRPLIPQPNSAPSRDLPAQHVGMQNALKAFALSVLRFGLYSLLNGGPVGHFAG